MKAIQVVTFITLAIPSITTYALDTPSPEITNIKVSPSLLETVQQQLPEQTSVNPAFLNTDYAPHLSLNQDADVSVTFIDEGAGYKNSLGWMTFADDSLSSLTKADIDLDQSGNISLNEINAIDGVNTGWLFPNASEAGGGGNLLPGDTVKVTDGAIAADTSLSFFLAQNAWNPYKNEVSDGVLGGERQLFYGLDFLNPEADFSSTLVSSQAESRHIAMLFASDEQEQVITGFEDLNRINRYANDWKIASDDDFNDAVFIINSNPADAFGESNIATAPMPAMGSGISGILLLTVLAWLAGLLPLPAKLHSR
ncbi:MAG: DUF4114 domain-containing protein [Cycloclasticus sp.]